jgi:Family of unknown function (DUF6339)
VRILASEARINGVEHLKQAVSSINARIAAQQFPSDNASIFEEVSSEHVLHFFESDPEHWAPLPTEIASLLDGQEERLSKLTCDPSDVNLSDLVAAEELYSVLELLPSYWAVNWELWAGLAFGCCSSFMRQRWPVRGDCGNCAAAKSPSSRVGNAGRAVVSGLCACQNEAERAEKAVDKVKVRWIGRGEGITSLNRHGIARLWWIARLAHTAAVEAQNVCGIDKSQVEAKRGHYLRVLFADQNVQWAVALRRYGAIPRLVCVLLERLFADYMTVAPIVGRPHMLRPGCSIDEVKDLTRLLNAMMGGVLYDRRPASAIEKDISNLQSMIRQGSA